MAYIASDKIGVFPLSKNRTSSTPLNSRLFYESNVSNIINQLIDKQGFVITDSTDVIINNSTFTRDFEFNLGGYYFKILNGSTLSESINEGPIYAVIILTGTPLEVKGQDNNDNYEGLIITNTNPESIPLEAGDILKYIKILDEDFKIEDSSKVKFNFTTLGITEIDGKV